MLRLLHINKSFKTVHALRDVNIHILPGQVHAICGENGAGKSTLMHIISGSMKPDSGHIYWLNKEITLANVQEAQKLGIAIVYQDRTLAGSLSVAENIFPVHPVLNKFGFIDFATLYKQTEKLLGELGMSDIFPITLVDSLSPARQQMVEIARALATNPALLVLDEPTASLSGPETEILFGFIKKLIQKGTAVIYISHRLAEIGKIADLVSVLKDGMYQGTFNVKSVTPDFIVNKMVGRDLDRSVYMSHVQPVVVLNAEQLSGKGFSSVSFSLFKGEVLGVAGLEGSGRTELSRAIFGDAAISAGKLTVNGKIIEMKHPADSIKAGIAYLPEDRRSLGLFTSQDIVSNIVAASLNGLWYNDEVNMRIAATYRERINIKSNGLRQTVNELSGGNQQKIILAKWMNTQPGIFIINEPTHGVDVGAKASIYRELKKLTVEGKSILLISSDLPELLSLSDRVMVMYRGAVKSILTKDEMSEERIASLASGL